MQSLIKLIDLYGYTYLFIQLAIILILYILIKMELINRRIMMIYTTFLDIIYISWRLFFTIVTEGIYNFIFSLLLFFWESVGLFQHIIFYITMWNPLKRAPVETEGFYPTKDGKYPTVDFFIPTYNESVDILKRTLVACMNIDYPKDKLKIYILDDGRRENVKKLASELGVMYIDRQDNTHAKAGNLNNALRQTSGELIATIDADMIPKSNFLKEMVGYFQKRNVGFVQAPQIFFNPDPFQYNLASLKQIPNEQDFFMIEMLAGKDRYNATMYVGSNTLFSRKALESIGGFAMGSITEDIATGMLLQAKGYKSIFVKKVLAKGLAPESFSELLHQRDRWARGNIQAFKKWNPLFYPGLTLMQRLLYFSGVIYWYFGIQKLVFILAPILFLVFDIRSINTTLTMLLIMWVPKFISEIITFQTLSANRRNINWSHIYETAMAPKLAISVIKETLGIKNSKKFRVTQKGILSSNVHIVWETFLFYSLILLLTLIGIIKSLIYYNFYHYVPDGYIINIFWSIFNLSGVIMSILVSIEKPRQRKAERFLSSVKCILTINQKSYHGYVKDISETGVKIQTEISIPHEDNDCLFKDNDCVLYIPYLHKDAFRVKIVAADKYDPFTFRFIWNNITLEQYSGLINFIFNTEEDINKEYKLTKKSNLYLTLSRSIKDKINLLSKTFHKTKKQNETIYTQSNNNNKWFGT